MVQPWRIQLQNIDKSQTAAAPVGTVGAMVIRATRGPSIPTYVSTGDESRILKIFGKPSAACPDVWEAIQFNKSAGIWISAPFAATDTYGAAILKSAGTTAITAGLTEAQLDGYTFSAATDYAIIVTKSPATGYTLGVKTTYDTVNLMFVTVVAEKINGTYVPKETLNYSFVPGAKDSYGKIIYYEDVFTNSDLVMCVKNPSMVAASPILVNDTDYVELDGSARDVEDCTSSVIATGWVHFQKSNLYRFDIAMDNTSYESVPTSFESLRSTYQTFADYLYPVAMAVAPATAISTRTSTGPNNDGLQMFINHFQTIDTYNGGYFWTSWIGRVGYQYAIMDDVYNGLSPMWINDAQGHGGQLGSGAVSAEWDFSQDQLELLDAAGINAISMDPSFGVMIMSDKTMKSPATTSDYSYVPHRRLFDYIKKRIMEQVLVYYIGKPNNASTRNFARSQGEAILSPIVGRGLLAEATVRCDETNNTDAMLAERKLIYEVGVKVTVNAQRILFNFVNAGQTMSVTDALDTGGTA